MPIYEYKCRQCQHQFEVLVRGSNAAVCPSCQGHDLEQLPSLFAVNSDATRKSALRSARQQNAKARLDHTMAEKEAAEHAHHEH